MESVLSTSQYYTHLHPIKKKTILTPDYTHFIEWRAKWWTTEQQKQKSPNNQGLLCNSGGEGGIRTHGTLQYA
jgi:hypothetical protein